MPAFYKTYKKEIGLTMGILLSMACFISNPFEVTYKANQVLAIAILMIIWWIFEAIPMSMVALLPLLLFPLLNIIPLKEIAYHYADPIVFLFMGGFFIAIAIEKWNLHKRIALSIIGITGTNGNSIILGFIMATGALSLWLSNTATTMMMFPVALSVIQLVKTHNKDEKSTSNFSLSLLFSIAYASNFAVGTIIATPPNVAYVGYIKDRFGYTINFVDWLLLFMPLTLLLLLLLYWFIVKILYPNNIKHSKEATIAIKTAQKDLGSISVPEKRVLLLFAITVFLWITKDFLNKAQDYLLLDDTNISMLGALLLFLVPSGNKGRRFPERLMAWPDARHMAWDILLLIGGGIALANTLETSQLIHQFGFGLADYTSNNLFIIILMVTAITVFLSEIMSNIAIVLILSPIVTTMALALNINPLFLGIPMTLGASCACMLPMGTPPNAIIFAKGHIKIEHMIVTGLFFNIICILLITVFCWFFLPKVMDFPL